MKILVIGGGGFIGRYLVEQLVQDPGAVITITSRKKADASVSSGFNNVQIRSSVDICNYNDVLSCVKDQDVVFNLAGYISFKHKDKEMLHAINHVGALNVMRACEEFGVKRLIHLSSTAALGYGTSVIDEDTTFDWSCNTKCPYSHSKATANAHLRQSTCDTIIAYPALVLGPEDTTNTLPYIQAIQNRTMVCSAPGSNSTVDVRDVARALVFFMNTKEYLKEYIIAEGTYSFTEVNKKIADMLHVRPPLCTLPRWTLHPLSWLVQIVEWMNPRAQLAYEQLFLSFKHRAHSSKRLRDAGFTFTYTLDQTLKDSIEWATDSLKKS